MISAVRVVIFMIAIIRVASGAESADQQTLSFTIDPADESTNVPLLPSIKIEFSMKMNIMQDERLIGLYLGSPEDGEEISVYKYWRESQTLILKPKKELADDSTFTVKIGEGVLAKDGKTAILGEVLTTFRTIDKPKPPTCSFTIDDFKFDLTSIEDHVFGWNMTDIMYIMSPCSDFDESDSFQIGSPLYEAQKRCIQGNSSICRFEPHALLGSKDHEITYTSQTLGRINSEPYATWELINDKNPKEGVRLVYTNGNNHCGDDKEMRTYINFHCRPKDVEFPAMTMLTKEIPDQCKYIVDLETAASCPTSAITVFAAGADGLDAFIPTTGRIETPKQLLFLSIFAVGTMTLMCCCIFFYCGRANKYLDCCYALRKPILTEDHLKGLNQNEGFIKLEDGNVRAIEDERDEFVHGDCEDDHYFDQIALGYRTSQAGTISESSENSSESDVDQDNFTVDGLQETHQY